MYKDYADRLESTMDTVNALENGSPSVYADFHAYLNGEKALLNLTTP